jgi:hypothetical protein
MDSLLNVELLRRPTNWFVVGTMVLMGLFALHFMLHLIHGSPNMAQEKHASRFA